MSEEKTNLFGLKNLFNVSIPKKEWNDIEINKEKDIQHFFCEHKKWLEEIICKIFDFTTLEFLGIEYECHKKRFDMAYKHGEDILIIEIKQGYGANNKKAFNQLKEYKEMIENKHTNKVYTLLITTHLTSGIIEDFQNQDYKTGIIILDQKIKFNERKPYHYIDFMKTRYGTLGSDKE